MRCVWCNKEIEGESEELQRGRETKHLHKAPKVCKVNYLEQERRIERSAKGTL